MNRRYLLAAVAVLPICGCTNNQLDPQKVVDAIKASCNILVPVATVVTMIGLDPTMTVAALVNAVCSAFQTAQMAQAKTSGAKATSGQEVHFVVVINGKPVDVVATVQ